MPVNLIILEQRGKQGNRTKAMGSAEAKTQAETDAWNNLFFCCFYSRLLLLTLERRRDGDTIFRQQKLQLLFSTGSWLGQVLCSRCSISSLSVTEAYCEEVLGGIISEKHGEIRPSGRSLSFFLPQDHHQNLFIKWKSKWKQSPLSETIPPMRLRLVVSSVEIASWCGQYGLAMGNLRRVFEPRFQPNCLAQCKRIRHKASWR